MADRYWVGGTGNWNDASHWSTTSGGAGGASVPTADDNAYFDGSSDAGAPFTVSVTDVKAEFVAGVASTTLTVTSMVSGTIDVDDVVISGDSFTVTALGTGTGGTGTYTISPPSSPVTRTWYVYRAVKDLIVGDGVTVTALDQPMTLQFSALRYLAVSGSLYFPPTDFTVPILPGNFYAPLHFIASTTGNTVTLNGAQNGLQFLISGGEWTLGSAANLSTSLTDVLVARGSLITNNYNVTSRNFTVSAGASVTFGTSVVRFFNCNFNAAATVSAASATMEIATNASNTFILGGHTYGNIVSEGNNGTAMSFDGFTCANFTATDSGGSFSAGVRRIFFLADVTVTGTFAVTYSSPNLRKITSIAGRIRTSTSDFGPATITAAAVSVADGAAFGNVIAAGASAPWDFSAQDIGDEGYNTNITFRAPKTFYWNLAGNQNWDANAWATTPTGTPSLANFPIAQDTAVITEAGAAGNIFMNSRFTINTITFDDGISPRSSAVVFTSNTSFVLTGTLRLTSAVTFSGTQTMSTIGPDVRILSANRTFVFGITHFFGTLTLEDNLTLGPTNALDFREGLLDLNGNILSVGNFQCSSTYFRSIAFGTSKIQITGASSNVLIIAQTDNFSYTGSGLFEVTDAGSTTRNLNNASNAAIYTESQSVNLVVTAGEGIVNVTGRWKNVTFTGFNGVGNLTSFTAVGNLTLSPTMTCSVVGGGIIFSALGTQTLTTNGVVMPMPITKNNVGTLRLLDTLNMEASYQFAHNGGTVDLNNHNLSCRSYTSSNSNIRSLIFGSGQILLQGTGTVWETNTSANMTLVPGTGKIVLANNTNTARVFFGGNLQTFPEVVIGGGTGTATTVFNGANRLKRLSSTKTVPYTIEFASGVIFSVDDWAVNGSEGNLVTLARTGSSGRFTLNYTGPTFAVAQYLSISNSNATPAGRLYAVLSTDGGNNTGWVFDAPKFGAFLSFFDVV